MMRFIACVFLLGIIGCQAGSDAVPVTGMVRLDGQPLAHAGVMFVPDGTGRDATSTTDEQGRFEMSTYEPRDGAVPGKYKVVITPAAPISETPGVTTADEAMEIAAKQPAAQPTGKTVPPAYQRPDQTPLRQDVPATGEVVIDIKSN